jgi:hypothetical protein
MSFEHPWIGDLLYQARKSDELRRVERAERLRALEAVAPPRTGVRTALGAAVMRGGSWIAGERLHVYIDCAGHLAVEG